MMWIGTYSFSFDEKLYHSRCFLEGTRVILTVIESADSILNIGTVTRVPGTVTVL